MGSIETLPEELQPYADDLIRAGAIRRTALGPSKEEISAMVDLAVASGESRGQRTPTTKPHPRDRGPLANYSTLTDAEIDNAFATTNSACHTALALSPVGELPIVHSAERFRIVIAGLKATADSTGWSQDMRWSDQISEHGEYGAHFVSVHPSAVEQPPASLTPGGATVFLGLAADFIVTYADPDLVCPSADATDQFVDQRFTTLCRAIACGAIASREMFGGGVEIDLTQFLALCRAAGAPLMAVERFRAQIISAHMEAAKQSAAAAQRTLYKTA